MKTETRKATGMDADPVPKGHRENSPAFQRRVGRRNGIRPEGTAEIPYPKWTESFEPDDSAVPSGLIHLRTIPGVKTPGYSRGVPSGREMRHIQSRLPRGFWRTLSLMVVMSALGAGPALAQT